MIGFAALFARLCLPLGVLFSLLAALTPSVGRGLPSTGSIAFDSVLGGNVEIVLLDIDRAITHNLTRHPNNDSDITWSPDGRRYAFIRQLGQQRTLHLGALSVRPHPAVDLAVAYGSRPFWSPDGQYIALEVTDGGSIDVYLFDPDRPSSADNPFVISPHRRDDRFPRWSPDGSRLAFVSWREGNPDLYTFETATGAVSRLTESPRWEMGAAWSPDGSRIAYMSDANGYREVYVVNADGSFERRLTEFSDPRNGSYWSSPIWSRDGQRIIFGTVFDFGMELMITEVDGGHIQRLTYNSALDALPVLTPDGAQIVFLTNRHGDSTLYIMGMDGENQRRLPVIGAVVSPAIVWVGS